MLGLALMRLENWTAADNALRKHLQLNPHNGLAARLLAQVCRALGRTEEALRLDWQSRILRTKNHTEAQARLADLRTRVLARAATRQTESLLCSSEPASPTAELASVVPLDFILVSGLPRSGTSLMMQILRAGGLEVMHDGKRCADEDNPEGYWEWEEIKTLQKNPRIIEMAAGKVVKVISALLPCLPSMHRYKIIFMLRPVEQVVDSQWRMLARSGRQAKSEKAHLIATQQVHVNHLLATLRDCPRIELLEVDFPSLVADPFPQIAKLRSFLGNSLIASPDLLAEIPRPELFRNRSTSGS
jgi:tetratricopeptide (TPR) repeat protein